MNELTSPTPSVESNDLSDVPLGTVIDSGRASQISHASLTQLGLVHMTINSQNGHDNILDTIDNAVVVLREAVKKFGKWTYVGKNRFRWNPDDEKDVTRLKEALVTTPRVRVTGSLRGGGDLLSKKTPTAVRKFAKSKKEVVKKEVVKKVATPKKTATKSKSSKAKKASSADSSELLTTLFPVAGGTLPATCVGSDEEPTHEIAQSEIPLFVITARAGKDGGLEIVRRLNDKLVKPYMKEVATLVNYALQDLAP